MFCCLSDDVECNWTERQRQLAVWAFGRWKFYQYTSLRVGWHYILLLITMVTIVVVIVKNLLHASFVKTSRAWQKFTVEISLSKKSIL